MKTANRPLSNTIHLLCMVFLLAAPVFFTGCAEREEPPVMINYPYEPDTPAPPPHEGVFTSEHGTMTFPGDGESVIIDFDTELSEYLGLPEGEQEAKYYFLSGDLPPHGHIPIRYDAAHMIRIITGEGDGVRSADIDIGEYVDGNFSTGTDHTTADRITFFVKWNESRDWEPVDFIK